MRLAGLLSSAIALVALSAAAQAPASLTPPQRQEIVQAAWDAVDQYFYDPKFRGVDWKSLRDQYLQKAATTTDAAGLASLIREMLGRLNNSHTWFFLPEELELRQHVLPFFYERAGPAFFISRVLVPLRGEPPPIVPGDDLVEVDGVPAARLTIPLWNRLYSPLGNPYFGKEGTTAAVRIRRNGQELTVHLARVRRFSSVHPFDLEMQGDIAVLRVLSLSAHGALLSGLLDRARSARALVLDLRYSTGGDLSGSLLVASALLGAGRELYTEASRRSAESRAVVRYNSYPPAPGEIEKLLRNARVRVETVEPQVRLSQKLAVLINGRTESEAELLAAALREHGRARLFGSRTSGDTAGWALGMNLPYKFGSMAVPYTWSVSPQGNNYEGKGLPPHVWLQNEAADYAAGRDAVLAAALEYLSERPALKPSRSPSRPRR